MPAVFRRTTTRAPRRLALIALAASAAACQPTSAELVIHLDLAVPRQLDAMCVRLGVGRTFVFARRYGLLARRGRAQSIGVVAGAQREFQALVQGQRRGMPVAEVRRRVRFAEREITRVHVRLAPCAPRPGGMLPLGGGGRLTDRPGSVVAAVPVAFAPVEVIVPWQARSGAGASRFAYNRAAGRIERHPLGLPTPAAEAIEGVLAADLDGDCHEDLLVLQQRGARLWRQRGDGTFAAAGAPLLGGARFTDAAAADLDGDGDLDLALASPATGLAIALHVGGGRFVDGRAGLPASGLGDATAVAIGLLDGDGEPDILVGRGGTKPQPDLLLLGSGRARFRAAGTRFPAVATRTRRIRLLPGARPGDPPDVLVLSVEGTRLYRPGGGAYREVAAALPQAFRGALRDAAVADMDGDCATDLVLLGSAGVTPLIRRGAAFRATATLPAGGATRIAARDVDGDGLPDLLLAGGPGGASWIRQGGGKR